MPAWCRSSASCSRWRGRIDREREGPPGKGRRPGRRRDAPRPPRPRRPVRGRGPHSADRALPCGAGRAPRSTATPPSPSASSARARGSALNAQFRGRDHATNVLTFVYDDGRRSPATSCCARRCCAARRASRARNSPTTSPTSSSTACCTCRASTTTTARTARRDGAPRNRDPRRARHPGPLRDPAPSAGARRRPRRFRAAGRDAPRAASRRSA